MKNLAIILILLIGCAIIPEMETAITYEAWERYKQECYNDSTMQIIELKRGKLIDGEIIFYTDTIYTHKTATWDEFISK